VTLRRAGKRLNALDVVVPAVKPSGVQLVPVCPDAAFAVADDGVVFPAVPYACDDLDEFGCARVAVGMVGMGGFTESCRGQRCDGGDDVPAGTTAAEMVQRRG
jgi:hypothetical protein